MSLDFTTIPDEEKIDFKKRLLDACLAIIRGRMDYSAAQVVNAQLAANNEEKSSAGDKYETSRAMSHLEKDMYAKQLAQTRQELALLMETNCRQVNLEATKGAIVVCGQDIFFLAAGLGKLQFEKLTILVLSPFAPMGRLLLGKKAGEQVAFNRRKIVIEQVF